MLVAASSTRDEREQGREVCQTSVTTRDKEKNSEQEDKTGGMRFQDKVSRSGVKMGSVNSNNNSLKGTVEIK